MTLSFGTPLPPQPVTPATDSGATRRDYSDANSWGSDSFQAILHRTSEDSASSRDTQASAQQDKAMDAGRTRHAKTAKQQNTRTVSKADDAERGDTNPNPVAPVPVAMPVEQLPTPPIGTFPSLISLQQTASDTSAPTPVTPKLEAPIAATNQLLLNPLSIPNNNVPVSSFQSQIAIPTTAGLATTAAAQQASTPVAPSTGIAPAPPIHREIQDSVMQQLMAPIAATLPVAVQQPALAAPANAQPSAAPVENPQAPTASDRAAQPSLASAPLSPQTLAFAMRLGSIDQSQTARTAQLQTQDTSANNFLVSTGDAGAIAVKASLLSSGEDASKNHSSDTGANGGGYLEFAAPSQQPATDNSFGALTQSSATQSADSAIATPAPPNSEPVRNVLLQLKGEDNARVDVRLVDRGGELHVSVKSADAALAQRLQEHMPDLTSRLDAEHFTTEVWMPGLNESARAGNNSFQSSSQNDASSYQPGQNDNFGGRQQQGQGQSRPDWVDLLEDQIS